MSPNSTKKHEIGSDAYMRSIGAIPLTGERAKIAERFFSSRPSLWQRLLVLLGVRRA